MLQAIVGLIALGVGVLGVGVAKLTSLDGRLLRVLRERYPPFDLGQW